MKKDFRDPRAGLIVALGVLIAALWLVVAYGAYEESKRAKYDVTVRPGAVTYGTHSTAVIPMVSPSMRRSSVPMISGGAVRSYAHSGHASMPSTTSNGGYRLHTTSSATVHTIGSGGGGGGGANGGGTGSSSRGISYSGGGFSVPTLALATPSYASETTSDSRFAIGPRRAKPTDPGYDGEWSDDGAGDDKWYRWDDWAGEWVDPEIGDSRPADDGVNYYRYDGGGVWTLVDDQGNPVNPSPIGDAPWMLILLFVGTYCILKTIRKKQNSI